MAVSHEKKKIMGDDDDNNNVITVNLESKKKKFSCFQFFFLRKMNILINDIHTHTHTLDRYQFWQIYDFFSLLSLIISIQLRCLTFKIIKYENEKKELNKMK